jgi:hypothetical protein
MSLQSDVEPTKSGFSSRQEYRLSQELASRFEQKMFYIGKGLGTHAYDSTLGEFRPSANGDHVIQEVEIYDNASSAPVRKTSLHGDWHFRPAKPIAGILGDLAWSGVLAVEEHIDARNNKAVSYIPGYLSLFPDEDSEEGYGEDGANINNPVYADISYRQDIDYHAKNSIYKSRLYFLPGLRLARGYREGTFETALLTERKKFKLLLSAEPKYLSVSRKNMQGVNSELSYGEYDYQDISIEFVQSRELKTIFEIYIRERVGRIFDNSETRIAPIPADSSTYFQIKPGIAYRPPQGGMAELAYTFSYVPYAGEMDYRMAGGQSSGITHTVILHGDLHTGKHFNLSGLYRGESIKKLGDDRYSPMTHVFSLQVKAFL